jgi:predicted pyridoxine 5'-phosphate oxidase superfamily flavin-nucleotide-binding protein
VRDATIPPDARRTVERYPLCFVASVREDGGPNLSPKGTIRVWDASTLVFAHIASPGTVANVQRDPRVEVNVVDHFARRGWRFRGSARVTDDPAVVGALRREYSDEPYPFRQAVLIDVEEAAELVSPSYMLGLTEEELRADMREQLDRQTVAAGPLGVRAGVVCERCEAEPVAAAGASLCAGCRPAAPAR